MKLLFVGDTHGNTSWLTAVIDQAAENGVDYIVQCGDFGYWEHRASGVNFLADIEDVLAEHDMNLVWVDGNHENHPVLRRNYGPEGGRHQVNEFGFWRIRDHIFYAPRGHRWTWDGRDFLALGGAYSIDKEHRKVGKSWWWEELITDEEKERASAGGLVDIMVTHDCPAGVKRAIPDYGGLDRQKDRWPDSVRNREKLRDVVMDTKPYVLVHGHYHHRNTEGYRFPYDAKDDELLWWTTLIEGLACDEMTGNALVMDTKDIPHHG